MLQRRATFAARRRRGFRPYKRADRDHEKFHAEIAASLADLARRHAMNVELHASSGYAPAQIFNIDLTQRVGHNAFKADLESVGIETVSSALAKHWVVEGIGSFGRQLAAKARGRIGRETPTFIDAIERIGIVPPKEKIDRRLLASPAKDEIVDVDVETWPMSDTRLKKLGGALYKIAKDDGGTVDDMFHAIDYCAIRVRCSAASLLEIASLPEVARMSRPLHMQVGARLDSDIMEYGTVKGPGPNAPGILVVDSGVVRHPLLEPAIAGFVPVDDSGGTGSDAYDDQGHGTCVAGVAVYGDVRACADRKAFEPKVRLYSAKVMKRGPGGDAVFDDLIDGKIKRAVDEIAAHHPSCRIVNLSLGDSDSTIAPGMPQLRLASLIDRLSASHKGLMFVVSAGNIVDDTGSPYPHYLLHRPPAARLIDPATSAHAITVGSIFQRRVGLGYEDHPSPATRAGPGLAGMIKPDVVEHGGGYAGPDSTDVLTMNMDWARDGRLFTLDSGTSMSAPRVAHTLALMQKDRSDASRNLLKALLVSSAKIPSLRPPPLDALSPEQGRGLSSLSYVYGHGRPDFDRASHSRQRRVVFVHDGSMRLNHAELFVVRVPAMFTATGGRKTIGVTLAFDPPTDARKGDYLGVAMKYHLHKNVDLDAVRMCYEDTGKDANQSNPMLDSTRKSKVRLVPGARRRGAGIHQKAWATSRRDMGIDPTRPLVLVVIAEKKWVEERDYEQGYAVAVTFEHSSSIDLYSALKAANRARARGGAP